MKIVFILEQTRVNMRSPYNTKQKELIKRQIEEYQDEFTVKDLFIKLSKKDQTIGQTTVYRVVNNLAKNHILEKSIGTNGTLYYHVVKKCSQSGHCFLKCESCGKLTHTDCDELNMLSKHFKNKHHFEINQNNITIKGICEKCKI